MPNLMKSGNRRCEDNGLLVVVSMEERDSYGSRIRTRTDYNRWWAECLDRCCLILRTVTMGRVCMQGCLGSRIYCSGSRTEFDIDGKELYLPPNRIEENVPWRLIVGFLFMPFLILAGIIHMFRKKMRCPKCKSKLIVTDRVIQKATASVGGLAVRVYKCPVCGYSKEEMYKTNPMNKPPGFGPPSGGTGPFIGGFGRTSGKGTGSVGPRGFGGGRSGGGGASRKW